MQTVMLISKLKRGSLLFFLVVLSFLLQPVTHASAKAEHKVDTALWVAKMYRDEKSAMRHYRKEQYQKAYNIFQNTAEFGLKKSQYYLGIMYLKGQHVEISTETGMAWLGVAAEAEIEEWVALYDQIYAMLDETQQSLVQSKLNDHIGKYGMAAQNITCEERSKLGSRKKLLHCDKKVSAEGVAENFR